MAARWTRQCSGQLQQEARIRTLFGQSDAVPNPSQQLAVCFGLLDQGRIPGQKSADVYFIRLGKVAACIHLILDLVQRLNLCRV